MFFTGLCIAAWKLCERARMVLNEKAEICEDVPSETEVGTQALAAPKARGRGKKHEGGKAPRRAIGAGAKKRANPYRRLAQDKLETRHAQLQSSAEKFKTKYDTAAGRLALVEEEIAKRSKAAEA
jgi:hypothetical protein